MVQEGEVVTAEVRSLLVRGEGSGAVPASPRGKEGGEQVNTLANTGRGACGVSIQARGALVPTQESRWLNLRHFACVCELVIKSSAA